MSELKSMPDDESRKENYYIDPGEVNVHQFYPILDLTFGKQVAIRKEEPFRPIDGQVLDQVHAETGVKETKVTDTKITETTVMEKKKIAETKVTESNIQIQLPNSEDGDIITTSKVTAEEGISGGQEEEGILGDVCAAETDMEMQTEVFSTAVTEESLQAAKERIQKMSFSKHWTCYQPQINRSTAKIIVNKATEYFQKSVQLQDSGDFVGAITLLTKAINFKSDEPLFFAERGKAYLHLGDFQSAILNFRKACLLDPNSATFKDQLIFVLHLQGQTFFDLRLYTEALDLFSRASEMSSNKFNCQIRCISCLAALQKYGECLDLVNKCLSEHRTNPDLYIVRARLHELFADTNLCYQDVKEALNIDPMHTEGLSMMEALIKRANSHKMQALQLSIKGQDREALQKITLAIQTNPADVNFHVLRGSLYRKLKDFNAAVDDFLLALDKVGHKEDHLVFSQAQRQLLLTFNDFAVECFYKGCYLEAITLLNKALNGEKNEKSLYVNRGDCFFKQNELTFALQDYNQALELDPQDPSIQFRISLVYNDQGIKCFQDKDYSDAETRFNSAIEMCPLVGHFYISRCRTRYLTENLSGAREDFLRGLLLDPSYDGITSISSRLFPGKSLADIVNSPFGRSVQMKLASLVDEDSNETLARASQDIAGTRGTKQKTAGRDGTEHISPTETWRTSASSPGFTMCMADRDFFVRQAQEKREVGRQVKDAFINNRSLRYDGPKLGHLPVIPQ